MIAVHDGAAESILAGKLELSRTGIEERATIASVDRLCVELIAYAEVQGQGTRRSQTS